MGSIFDAMFYHLSQWDERYAHRWLAFILATHNPNETDLERACRFWSLELSAVDTESTRSIREHLVPSNDVSVILNIFSNEIIPLLAYHKHTFFTLSHSWGSFD